MGQTHLLLLESLLERKEKLELMLGTQTLVATIMGSSFYHLDTGADKHHFGNLPLVISTWTQLRPPAYWHQYWDTSGQAAVWARTQPHPPVSRLS